MSAIGWVKKVVDNASHITKTEFSNRYHYATQVPEGIALNNKIVAGTAAGAMMEVGLYVREQRIAARADTHKKLSAQLTPLTPLTNTHSNYNTIESLSRHNAQTSGTGGGKSYVMDGLISGVTKALPFVTQIKPQENVSQAYAYRVKEWEGIGSTAIEIAGTALLGPLSKVAGTVGHVLWKGGISTLGKLDSLGLLAPKVAELQKAHRQTMVSAKQARQSSDALNYNAGFREASSIRFSTNRYANQMRDLLGKPPRNFVEGSDRWAALRFGEVQPAGTYQWTQNVKTVLPE